LSEAVGLVITVFNPAAGAAYFKYLALLRVAIAAANGATIEQLAGQYVISVATAGMADGVNSIVSSKLTGLVVANGIASMAQGGKFEQGLKSALISYARVVSASYGERPKGGGGKEVSAGTPGTGTAEDRAAFQKSLDTLSTDGTLNPNRNFDSADAAAAEVLNATAGLSKQYGLEVAGSIRKSKDGWRYTAPEIGGVGSASLTTSYIGYHTHPSGSLKFSNQFNSYTGGPGDAGWVASSNKSLYLGVQIGKNVSIGVCSPGSCSQFGRLGTSPSRVLQ